MCNKKWGETPFFEIQETESGGGTVLKTFPDEQSAREFFNRIKEGGEKPVCGGKIRLVEVLEAFGEAGFIRYAHVGWEIQDTHHPYEENGLCLIHSTPDSSDVYNAWGAIVDGTGVYKDFNWNGNIKMIRVDAVHKRG